VLSCLTQNALRMLTFVIDNIGRLSVCLSCSFALLFVEQIEVLLGVETLGDPRNTMLDGRPDGFKAAFVELLWLFVYLLAVSSILNTALI